MEQVSWIRHRDVHILTVGRYNYASDQRFSIVRPRPSEDWTLQIKFSQARDSGLYECQVSTQPHRSQFVQLNVVGKKKKKKKKKSKPHIRTSARNAICFTEIPAQFLKNNQRKMGNLKKKIKIGKKFSKN